MFPDAAGRLTSARLTFLRPNLGPYQSSDAMEPLVFAILKGLTPPDFTCRLVDECVEPVPEDDRPDVVAITVNTFAARRAYALARQYRNRGARVVMGGFHVTVQPDEAALHADALVLGEAERVWPRLLADVKSGRLQKIYRDEQGSPPLGDLVFDRSLFQTRKYSRLHLVQFSRGCRFACDFCSIHTVYGRQIRTRNVDQVLREIKALKGNLIFFADDNLFADREQARALMTALVGQNTSWSCQASIDLAEDQELLTLMARSGCVAVLVGLESLREDNLRQMRKSWNTAHHSYADSIGRIQAHGIMVMGTFLFGYDQDTPEDIEQAQRFARENKLLLAHFNLLTPMPGTALHARLHQEHRLLKHPWWLHEDFRYGQAMFQPARMDCAQLERGCFDARLRFNSWRSILGRACGGRANSRSLRHLAIFLAVNNVNRREVRRKQGRQFGRE